VTVPELELASLFAVAPDGQRFVTTERSMPGITLFEAAQPDAAQFLTFPAVDLALGGPASVNQLSFTPDGTRLVVSGFYAPDTGKNAVWVVDLPAAD
jgi:hypothetical protein